MHKPQFLCITMLQAALQDNDFKTKLLMIHIHLTYPQFTRSIWISFHMGKRLLQLYIGVKISNQKIKMKNEPRTWLRYGTEVLQRGQEGGKKES